MADAGDWKKIIAGISDEQVLRLEQAAIRIPSTTFEEGALADHFATYMSDLGLDVEMMDVTHWAKPGKKTRQPIARLRGTGGGRSLMLNGHMDPGVEMSGWPRSCGASGRASIRSSPAGGCGSRRTPSCPASRRTRSTRCTRSTTTRRAIPACRAAS